MSDKEIIDTYRGLWEIEETFQIAKGDLEALPNFLQMEDRINAHLLSCFISLVIMRILQKKTGRYKCDFPLKPLDDFRIERLVRFIEINYKTGITLEHASKVLYLSPKQINRLMKKAFKITFHDYLQDLRLKTAKRLLIDSVLSIEEIAYQSGFSSHYYMYQAFKHSGMPTPAQVRSG